MYWPKMQEDVAIFRRGWMFCCTSKPTNMKHGLYHILPVATCHWESIFIDIVGGLPTTRKGHDHLFMVVDRLSKM